jgi:hypothetical protein
MEKKLGILQTPIALTKYTNMKFIKIICLVMMLKSLGSCRITKAEQRSENLQTKSLIQCDPLKKNIKSLNYKNGNLYGEASVFDSNGCLLEKGRYKKNKKIGLWEYYSSGQLEGLIYYKKNDTLIWLITNAKR